MSVLIVFHEKISKGIKWRFTQKKAISQFEAPLQVEIKHIKMKSFAILGDCLAIFVGIAAAQRGQDFLAGSSTGYNLQRIIGTKYINSSTDSS